MSRVFGAFAVICLAIVSGCQLLDGESGARVRVAAFDSALDGDVDHVWLTIRSVSIHRAGAADDEGWDTLATPNRRYDFLELVNGLMAEIADAEVEPGSYTQLRLTLADTNEIVVGGESHDLVVPSGAQSGVKLNLGFTVGEDEIIDIYVDFDASRSIKQLPGRYQMRPTFRAFRKVVSGTIAGEVADTTGAGVAQATVRAISGGDTTTTYSAADGKYLLILPAGTYNLSAVAAGLSPDTTYTGVALAAEQQLHGYGFTLR